MGLVTIGLIVFVAWIAMAILAVALCSASSHADAAMERAYARAVQRAYARRGALHF